MSQEQRVLKYLKEHKTGITQLEAYLHLGIMRLSARIFELKDKGYNIEREMVEVTDRWGEKTRVARYYLREKNNEIKTR